MARKDRTGNRKTRDQRSKRRKPEMGYYLVVTDTEGTERCFFNGLHDSLPDDMKKKLVIKVMETKTQNLVHKCLELTAYDAQYRIPWIVFDRDQVINFDQIIQEAERAGIHVLRYGCLHILVICRRFKIHGCAVPGLVTFIRKKQGRITQRQIQLYIRDYVKMETKKKRFQ